eukprot:COSAG06_NODE_2007_length_7858_cov_23.947158_9_plen_252_part_01
MTIAASHRKFPAQVALRWLIQHGAVSCPGADQLEYMQQDADLFNWELTQAEMRTLDAIQMSCDRRGTCTYSDLTPGGAQGGGGAGRADDPATETRRECNDGTDNDRDGLSDCDDPDCATNPRCLAAGGGGGRAGGGAGGGRGGRAGGGAGGGRGGAAVGNDCSMRGLGAVASSCPAAGPGSMVPQSCPPDCADLVMPWFTACQATDAMQQIDQQMGGQLRTFAQLCGRQPVPPPPRPPPPPPPPPPPRPPPP